MLVALWLLSLVGYGLLERVPRAFVGFLSTGRKPWKQYLYRAIIVLLVLATAVGLPANAQLSLQVSARIWVPSGIVLVCVFAVPTPTYIESDHDGSKLATYPGAATKKDV